MENKSSYQINEQGVLGEVKIADDVIAVIAGIAATEVTGVALELDYGVSIPEISEKVQNRVKSAIENMTGLKVKEVNVRVAGVAAEEE